MSLFRYNLLWTKLGTSRLSTQEERPALLELGAWDSHAAWGPAEWWPPGRWGKGAGHAAGTHSTHSLVTALAPLTAPWCLLSTTGRHKTRIALNYIQWLGGRSDSMWENVLDSMWENPWFPGPADTARMSDECMR
ncbi:hypothetical protein RRG08_045345 [Elysia crispata]|uniref:Uncharacterized protein n=1 Tax=Elysia crispata TaxID=231223 RepID=A0AAE1A1Q0_9GAST|nr:hypothetical protein RRG08_045345 [Elysia crispata]